MKLLLAIRPEKYNVAKPRSAMFHVITWTALFHAAMNSVLAQPDIEEPPILYSQSTSQDRVARLRASIAAGDSQLTWDRRHGWLPSLLQELEVPRSSQTLVFSKTSLQFRRISPSRPRAVYLNDDVYVGWVQGGEVIELAAVDPQLGAVFYTLKQNREEPVIARDKYGECLSCHLSGRTQQVPGFLVRSVFVQHDGQPELRLGSITSDHRTPFLDRYGGWYVTGHHGEMLHRGNHVLPKVESAGVDAPSKEQLRKGANLASLPSRVVSDAYLEPTSDLVALLLLEHQSQFHNAVTKASFTARRTLHQQAKMNEILERASEYQSESTERRLNSVTNNLVDYLLFVGEAPLTSPIRGRKDFQAWFSTQGPHDAKGRTLRTLDLKSRLLRYPCSYLIYSDAVLSLPTPIVKRLRQRILEILESTEVPQKYAHLSKADRDTILSILRETHPFFK